MSPARSPARIYRGAIEDGARIVTVIDARAFAAGEGVSESPLDPRHDLANHSPDGFAWGYGGGGPAQLALALLADAFGEDGRALCLYQQFKQRFVSMLDPEDGWSVSADEVRAIAAGLAQPDADASDAGDGKGFAHVREELAALRRDGDAP